MQIEDWRSEITQQPTTLSEWLVHGTLSSPLLSLVSRNNPIKICRLKRRSRLKKKTIYSVPSGPVRSRPVQVITCNPFSLKNIYRVDEQQEEERERFRRKQVQRPTGVASFQTIPLAFYFSFFNSFIRDIFLSVLCVSC